MKLPNSLAIGVFAYNRPSHLRRVLISLENYKISPSKNIYLFLDGPRNYKDKILQREIALMSKYNPYMKIKLKKSKENKGLAKAITSGIDFLSKRYKNVIILEDDCIPRKEFFLFVFKLLKKKKFSENFGLICGYQFPEIQRLKDKIIYPMVFKYFIPWGWCVNSKYWKDYRKKVLITKKNISLKNKLAEKIKKLTLHKKGQIWSLNFILYNLFIKRKIIFPNKSLIKNIGFDGSGINSSITDKFNTFYRKTKKISANKIIENKKLQKKQLLILSKTFKYFY